MPVEGAASLVVRVYKEEGDLPPVLCVHGLASNARTWDQMAGRLATLGHPIAAVDQRGHGASARSAAGGPYDWAVLCADLIAVSQAMSWLAGPRVERPPVVVGQSWGASVVLELCARHPEAVRAAVLVDGGTTDLADGFADWASCEAALMPPVLAGTPAEVVRRRLRAEHPDWTEEGIAATMANLEIPGDGTVTAWLPREDHRRILRLLWEHRPALVYPEVTVPVLLVPAQDAERSTARFMPMKREQVSRAEAALRSSATRWVTGDHDLHVQHPELLAEFVAQVARGGLP